MNQNKTNRRDFLSKLFKYSTVAATGTFIVTSTACDDAFGKSTYTVDSSKCDGCGDCLSACHFGAITISSKVATISSSKYVGCGKCVSYCKKGANSYS